MRKIALVSLLPLLLAATFSVQAQPRPSWRTGSCNGDIGNTHNDSVFGPRLQVCQLRRILLPANGKLNLRNKNGGIQIYGQERNTIALEARVIVKASSQAQAQRLESRIKIQTSGIIHATGPTSGLFGPTWYVNYRLFVPQKLAAHIKTENGGIGLHQLQGIIHAETTNGGLTLDALSGSVLATTINGGINVLLNGATWLGTGLKATSVNGGISIKTSPNYSAHLILQTVNGGISNHLPNTNLNIQHNQFDGNLGQGGPTINLQTVNGGISLNPE